jgi:hypothetical protein
LRIKKNKLPRVNAFRISLITEMEDMYLVEFLEVDGDTAYPISQLCVHVNFLEAFREKLGELCGEELPRVLH